MHKSIVCVLLALRVGWSQEPVPSQAETVPSAPPAAILSVRNELETMFETDQAHRREVNELERKHGRTSAEVKQAWSKQKTIDTQNIRRLEAIIAGHGWPGITQFGSKASSAAFLILQHSDIEYQKKYLPVARTAAGKGEMRASALALLEDRVRLREGQKQIYGSQVTRNSADQWEPLPLEDEAHVDALRASVGLGPLADYLQSFATRSGGAVNPKWTKPAPPANPNKASEPTPGSATPRAPTSKPTGATGPDPAANR